MGMTRGHVGALCRAAVAVAVTISVAAVGWVPPAQSAEPITIKMASY